MELDWFDKPKMRVVIDTIYETEDEESRESYACAVKIVSAEGISCNEYRERTLFELSQKNIPTKIIDDKGVLIWTKEH